MALEYLRKQLITWQKVLLVCIGAGSTLVLTALGDIGARPATVSAGWFGVWLLLLLGTLPAGLALLTARDWRPLPLDERMDTAFGYLAVAWLAALALFIRFLSSANIAGSHVAGSGCLISVILMSGALLGALYLQLRRRGHGNADTMFP